MSFLFCYFSICFLLKENPHNVSFFQLLVVAEIVFFLPISFIKIIIFTYFFFYNCSLQMFFIMVFLLKLLLQQIAFSGPKYVCMYLFVFWIKGSTLLTPRKFGEIRLYTHKKNRKEDVASCLVACHIYMAVLVA